MGSPQHIVNLAFGTFPRGMAPESCMSVYPSVRHSEEGADRHFTFTSLLPAGSHVWAIAIAKPVLKPNESLVDVKRRYASTSLSTPTSTNHGMATAVCHPHPHSGFLD